MIAERIDGVTGIPEAYRTTVCPPPKAIKVSLDDRCQFKCSFCANGQQEHKSELPWEVFTSLVDEMVDIGIKELGVFYIGEPMLAKRLVEAVRYAKQAGIEYVFCTTNGALADPIKVGNLMQAGLDSLKFSFNYANGNQIRQIAGVAPKNFDRIVENIKAAGTIKKTNGYRCGIYASSIMLDGRQGEAMKEAVEEIKPYVDEHYWLPLFSFGGQTEFGKPVRGNPGRLDQMREPLPCWAVFTEGHVTADGDISLCCFDSHKRWVVGNLKETAFMDAWNCDAAQQLRAAHLKKDVTGTACEHCAIGS